jgi:hypothetical protein
MGFIEAGDVLMNIEMTAEARDVHASGQATAVDVLDALKTGQK